jgi:hypothetical protein
MKKMLKKTDAAAIHKKLAWNKPDVSHWLNTPGRRANYVHSIGRK